MATPLPTAPPRRKKHIDKKDISEPYDFVHVSHVGLDFNSEDVKRAIRPTSSEIRTPPQDNFYEPVIRSNETPILSSTPPQNDFTPPLEQAPKYGRPSTAESEQPSKEDIVEYVNRPSAHLYMNVNSEARPSRKKNPPPPPPQAEKPPLIEEPTVVTFRAQLDTTPESPLAEAPSIGTAQRIEVAPPSVVLDRPGMLGEMRLGLGLDDPIPLTAGLSSKYRTPTMITPREMAVDVPTPMRTEAKEEPPVIVAPKAPLVKEKAVDVPTPPKPQDKPKVFLDPPVEKRMAPSPPAEPEAPPPPPPAKPAAPYVPPSAARSSPHLKNVISELKVKQTGSEEQKEEVEENNNEVKKEELLEKEETHEYIALTAVRTSGASVDSQNSSGTAAKVSKKQENTLTPKDTKVVGKEAKPSEVKASIEVIKVDPKVCEANPVTEAKPEEVNMAKKTVGFEETRPSEAPEVNAEDVSKKPVKEVKKPETEAPVVVPQVQPQKVPTPVPRTRITVPKEPVKEAVTEEVQQDDGIDTGCSDEDEVIRL